MCVERRQQQQQEKEQAQPDHIGKGAVVAEGLKRVKEMDDNIIVGDAKLSEEVREIEEREITNNKGEGTMVDEAGHRESKDIRETRGCVQEDGRMESGENRRREKGRVEG